MAGKSEGTKDRENKTAKRNVKQSGKSVISLKLELRVKNIKRKERKIWKNKENRFEINVF